MLQNRNKKCIKGARNCQKFIEIGEKKTKEFITESEPDVLECAQVIPY